MTDLESGQKPLDFTAPRPPTLSSTPVEGKGGRLSALRIDPVLAKRILYLASPVVAAMLSQTALNLVDHILVGYLPEEERTAGQGALGISLVLLWLVGGFLSAVSVGTQALSARRIGEKQPEDAGAVLTNSLLVGSLGSIAAAALAWWLAPVIFPFFHKDPVLLELGVPYLRWRFLGVISMVVTASYKSFFDGLGKTRLHMYAAILMNVVNFVLCLGFIFGRFGFPRMGVQGAGIASLVSSYVGLLIMMGWSLRGRYRKKYRYYRWSNASSNLAKQIIRLSLPSGLATVFVMTGFGLFFRIVGELDAAAGTSVYAAATQNIIQILSLTFITCLAYGTATATLVGQSLGAKEYHLAERYAWESVKIGAVVFAIIGLVTALFPEWVLSLVTHDHHVIAAAAGPLRILGLTEPLMVAALVFTQALFGAGNTKFVMWVEFTLHFLCLVPLAYLFGVVFKGGMIGVWSSAVVYVVLLAVIMGWKFHQGAWKKIEI